MPAGRKSKFDTVNDPDPEFGSSTVIRKGSKAAKRFDELRGRTEKMLSQQPSEPSLGPATVNRIRKSVSRDSAADSLGSELRVRTNIFGGDYERTKYAK